MYTPEVVFSSTAQLAPAFAGVALSREAPYLIQTFNGETGALVFDIDSEDGSKRYRISFPELVHFASYRSEVIAIYLDRLTLPRNSPYLNTVYEVFCAGLSGVFHNDSDIPFNPAVYVLYTFDYTWVVACRQTAYAVIETY